VNRASLGFKKESWSSELFAFESTLPPQSDGAARRVSERIESCFHPQSEFLLHDLLACLWLPKTPTDFKINKIR